MAFVNLSLLLGGILVAIPVALHLILRPQPKRILFPALRFLKERRDSNRRQLQLRHWILLFLRAAAIGLLALALARPSVGSTELGNWLLVAFLGALALAVGVLAAYSRFQNRGKWLVVGLGAVAIGLAAGTTALLAATLTSGAPRILGDQQAPVAAVLVFDTSPRMEYRYHNQSRLEVAKETGLWLLSQFPADSQIAVLESRPAPPFFCVDLAAARSSVDRLRTTGIPDSLPEVATRAIQLAETSDQNLRREVYLLTDMTRAAWPDDQLAQLRSALAESPNVAIYLIDVGVDQPRNVSLGAIELSAETLAKSSELVVAIDVLQENAPGDYTVELLVEEPDSSRPIVVDGKTLVPESQVRDRRTISLASGGGSNESRQRVEFRLRGWEIGTYQGSVRVVQEDGLPSDNTRFFAVEVREAWPVLVVTPDSTSGFLLQEALAPREQRETGLARFECQVIAPSDLANQDLSNRTVVCLYDPQPLPPTAWDQLQRYVERGGSLLIFLGHNAQPTTSFNEPAAQQLLGGKLARQWRSSSRDLFLAPTRFDHPTLALFREQASSIPWSDSPVFRHWQLDDRDAASAVVIDYSNGQPAILERPIGRGRVMVMTTPIAEEARPRGRSPWNELLTSDNAWPNFVLLNELFRYLARGGESRLNYLSGEPATLAQDPDRDPPRYQLFTPLDEPQDVVPRGATLTVPFTEFAGAYRLKGQRGGPVIRGFAVNYPSGGPTGSGTLARISAEQRTAMFADQGDRVRYARNRDEIVLEVGEARVGREFYPYLLLVLVVVLGLEHTLANRFYRRPTPA